MLAGWGAPAAQFTPQPPELWLPSAKNTVFPVWPTHEYQQAWIYLALGFKTRQRTLFKLAGPSAALLRQ
jgi:hypothetical protein